MKAISYVLFSNEKHLLNWYLRGLCFNFRMNRLLYPEWETIIHADRLLRQEYDLFFGELSRLGAHIYSFSQRERCYNMLVRMAPIWSLNTTHILCRDADAITTYREVCAVNEWLQSGKTVHGINDNPAHSIPMMGGMIGIDCQQFRQRTGINSFEELVQGHDLSLHGSDQDLLMNTIYPKVKDSFFLSKDPIQKRDNPLWESDLTCRHIGSAGVVEMETVRFFERFDHNEEMINFEKRFPEIFYWHG